MPLLHYGVPLGLGDNVKNLPQPLSAVGQQFDHHSDGVHNSAEEEIDGVPDAVSFAQIIERDKLAAGL